MDPSRCTRTQPFVAALSITMIAATSSRVVRPLVVRHQRRTFVDWMVNYPDKVGFAIFVCRRVEKQTPSLLFFGWRWLSLLSICFAS